MKKSLLIILYIFFSIIGHTQSSKLVVTIYDTNDVKFLNMVEEKKDKQLELTIQGKAHLTEVEVNDRYTPASWYIPMTLDKMKRIDTIREKIFTNTYEINLNWNRNLDTAFVEGFCREYYYNFYEGVYWDDTRQRTVFRPMGVLLLPLHMVPISEYNQFLTPKELNQL